MFHMQITQFSFELISFYIFFLLFIHLTDLLCIPVILKLTLQRTILTSTAILFCSEKLFRLIIISQTLKYIFSLM